MLLGAGFSKAVHSSMPLMPDLGAAVGERFVGDARLRRLLHPFEIRAIRNGQVPLGDVETWLSSVVADQPFLTASENMERRALAIELAEVIAIHLGECCSIAISEDMPTWLQRLVSSLHFGQHDVVTLNYDTLLESAVITLHLMSLDGGHRVRVQDVLDDEPPLVPLDGRNGGDLRVDTFGLHKVHGSLNWYGRVESTDLFSVVREDGLLHAWGGERLYVDPSSLRRLTSLTPMITAPTSSKGTLYANATMANIWLRAKDAVSAADDIVIFGYSLPPMDMSLRSFLAACVPRKAVVRVVDPRPEPVIEALVGLEVTATAVGGVESPQFEALLSRLEAGCLDLHSWNEVARGPAPHYVGVETTSNERWSVSDVRSEPDRILLVTEREPATSIVHPSPHKLRLPRASRHCAVAVRFGGTESVALAIRSHPTSEGSDVWVTVGAPHTDCR